MLPRRTVHSNRVFRLVGGNEDNDLWVLTDVDENALPVMRSTWEPTEAERERIAAGENIELLVWGTGHPPVAMQLDASPLKGVSRE